MGPLTNWSESPSHLPFRDNLFPHANPSVANFLNLRRFSNSSFWFRVFVPDPTLSQQTHTLKAHGILKIHSIWGLADISGGFLLEATVKISPVEMNLTKKWRELMGRLMIITKESITTGHPIIYWDALCLRLFILCLTQWYYPSFQETNLLGKEWHNFW